MTDKTEWLLARRKGIGGSDVAAILGLSRYRSPLDVYAEKTSEEPPEDKPSESAHFGTLLENVVAKEFADRTGMKVQRVNKMLRAGERDWMIANLDRAVVNPEIAGNVRVQDEQRQAETNRMLTTDAILECKTASAFIADQWGESQEAEIVSGKVVTEHKIPIYYETQVQWYMGITGAQVCYVAVLLGGQDFRIYAVNRDDDVIKALQEQCHEFWTEHVLKKVPPAPATQEEVQKLFTKDDGEMIEATNEVATDIGELRTLNEKIKQLEGEQKVVKDRICAALGEKTGFTIAGEKACTFKYQQTNRFDSTRFKKEQPETYADYVKTSESRVFRLSA